MCFLPENGSLSCRVPKLCTLKMCKKLASIVRLKIFIQVALATRGYRPPSYKHRPEVSITDQCYVSANKSTTWNQSQESPPLLRCVYIEAIWEL